MVMRLNPYLNFDGNCAQAMQHYAQVLGGTLHSNTFGEYGMEGPAAEQIMHAALETPAGFTLMASDLPPGMASGPISNGTISLSGDDEAELRRYWEQLSEGGAVEMPLEKQMWGDVFGQCTDRFGVRWMVNITGQQQG